jgi:hypothetical protein
MIIVSGDNEYDTNDPNRQPPHMERLYDAWSDMYVFFDPTNPISVFNAIQRVIGHPPMPPAVTAGTSLVPVMVAGPGGYGPILLQSFVVDPHKEAELTAEQASFNVQVQAWTARMTALTSQFDVLLNRIASKPA